MSSGRKPVPIGQIGRRIPEAGRIRTGEKGPVKVSKRTGKEYQDPQSIPNFRFTSAERENVEQVAAIYGGTVEPFSDPKSPDRWQVRTDATEIRVALPPDPLGGTPLYQLYGGGGPERRCDGVVCEQWRKGPDGPEPYEVDCLCAAAGALKCDVTTHLSLFLPEIRLTGVWRLTTKSYNAAVELPAMVDAIRDLQDAGIVRGVLSLKPHQQTLAGETRKFLVPTLGVDASMEALAGGGGMVAALPAPPPDVAALASGPDGRGVADGFAVRETEQAAGPPAHERGKEAHDGASEPEAHLPAAASGTPDDDIVDAEILPTPSEGGEVDGGAGVDPMGGAVVPPSTAVDVADLEALMRDRGVGKAAVRREYVALGGSAARWSDLVPGPALDAVYAWVESSGGGGGTDPGPEVAAVASPGAVQRSIHARITGLALDVDRDRLRHTLVSKATTGRTESSNDLTHDEGLEVHRLLDQIEAGTLKVGKTRANNLYELVAP